MDSAMPKGPLELAEAIEGHIAEIDRLGKLLDQAMDLLSNAETAWVEGRDDYLAESMERFARSDERAPSDPKLETLARKDNRDRWRTWNRARLTVDKLKRAIAREETMQSGRQTQLKALEAEARAPDRGPSPSWSR